MDVEKIFKNFEKIISFILILIMGIIVLLATIELVYILFKSLREPPGLLLGDSELFKLIGMMMMVLIAIELMSSVYVYCLNKVIYIEMMFLIAITAVTRKIVVMDAKSVEPIAVIGIAAVLAALVLGYYVVKKQQAVIDIKK